MTAAIGIGKFVGAPVRARTFEGVSLAENTYAAGLRVAAHAHDAPLLSLVLQGNATEDVAGRSRELGVRQLVVRPDHEPGEQHAPDSVHWTFPVLRTHDSRSVLILG